MNSKLIRKIAIGSDYPKGCMHYEVGQVIKNTATKIPLFTIKHIVQRGDTIFEIYVENMKGEQMLWDTFVNMPVVLQHELYL